MLTRETKCRLIRTAAEVAHTAVMAEARFPDATSCIGMLVAKSHRQQLSDLPPIMQAIGGQEFLNSVKAEAVEIEKNREEAIATIQAVWDMLS
jgi:hypothetical protein